MIEPGQATSDDHEPWVEEAHEAGEHRTDPSASVTDHLYGVACGRSRERAVAMPQVNRFDALAGFINIRDLA
ncbi:hypothetical protein Psi02_34500 [Planotetraspora silvatica]|uniref:Uncharacterized protein n=1 Tax=Planotetraspora silvatica TaxID=234614 RepID=A0A8J3UPE7_9ACTN|nr:hypothetical protein [Planotetraspora silvatica]GII47026.1 hypothetical protein Psi02_34500 [Planotetraspora silvatica]